MSNSSKPEAGCGKMLLWLLVLAVGFCCACLLPIGMVGSYYDRRALAEADREWAAGNRAVAVEKYRPLLKNTVFDKDDKQRIAERVLEFETASAAATVIVPKPTAEKPLARLEQKKTAVERVLVNARADQQQIAEELRKLNVRTAADLKGTPRGQELAKRLPSIVAEVEWIEKKIAELDGAILDEKRYIRQTELQQAGLSSLEQTERAERIKRLEEDSGAPPAELTPLDLEAAVNKTLTPPIVAPPPVVSPPIPEALRPSPPANADSSILKRLVCTKWRNTNGITFEWTAYGNFVFNGIFRTCTEIGPFSVEIDFGEGYKDKLVFNSDLTEFSQYRSRNNNELIFTDKRDSGTSSTQSESKPKSRTPLIHEATEDDQHAFSSVTVSPMGNSLPQELFVGSSNSGT